MRVLALGGAVTSLVNAFLPWTRSGATRRSGFATARTADALGFIEGAALRVLVTTWYLLPVVVLGAVVATVARRHLVSALLAVAAGVLGLTAAAIVLASPLRPTAGPMAAILAGIVAIAGGLGLAWFRSGVSNDSGRRSGLR